MSITSNVNDRLVGHVLEGRYRIDARIARGGMATVYRGTDMRLTRTVAIKVMHDGLGDDTDFARKFDREARAAARLSHPHVVSVFDQGIDNGRPFIVMEFVEGFTLRNLITAQAPMTPERALELIDPVVAALASAHEAGLVHRDVKPENVLISDRGQIKVADFGLAKALTGQTATATQGLLIGTVSYLPPELVVDGSASTRSDVYSVGVVLFEMLTGRKPHTGDTPIQVAYAHVHNDVPAPSSLVQASWRDSRRGIPPYLDALVQACTDRDVANRPPDGQVLLEKVRRCRRALSQGVMDDPDLTRSMATPVTPADEATEIVPRATANAHGAESTRPDRLEDHQNTVMTRWTTASTPVSPLDLEHSMDGVASLPPREDLPRTVLQPAVSSAARATRQRRSPRTPEQAARAPHWDAEWDEPRPTKRRRRPLRRLVAILLVLAVLGGAGYGGWFWLEGRWTTVPAMANQTETDAARTAEGAGVVVTFEQEYSETIPKGRVIRTDPAAGDRLLDGGSMTAYVSLGPERYPVPTVVGMGVDDAEAALTEGRLALGEVTERWDEQAPAGEVVEASIAPEELVKPGTPVDLVVSKGPEPIAIDDWSGKPAKDAQAELEGRGFSVKRSEQFSNSVPAGVVISQTPADGTGKRGDSIELVVSKGPELVTVPNVRSSGADEARKKLEDAGFKVQVSYVVNNGLGLVLRTDPDGGAKAPKGSTVTIFVV
ncbi:Stk1 family PASTA domain-containing Ser/Thr kinase [Parenemella sanctibonifatiensis]|uniref:non-specific serine/threonine protein kinase n=1 Tax=Parenemella sanctibonifatiensis TaxID=2016505 RepID=A0A255EDM9_9ACTN|nr:Stk1 family PASTA domain-containing Ser/Thr kinase [Parenemella sanctibonifatiensis]OYN89654.1 serine/threonine protein kinase [Parenemella sanctibonifatiensis]